MQVQPRFQRIRTHCAILPRQAFIAQKFLLNAVSAQCFGFVAATKVLQTRFGNSKANACLNGFETLIAGLQSESYEDFADSSHPRTGAPSVSGIRFNGRRYRKALVDPSMKIALTSEGRPESRGAVDGVI